MKCRPWPHPKRTENEGKTRLVQQDLHQKIVKGDMRKQHTNCLRIGKRRGKSSGWAHWRLSVLKTQGGKKKNENRKWKSVDIRSTSMGNKQVYAWIVPINRGLERGAKKPETNQRKKKSNRKTAEPLYGRKPGKTKKEG